MPEFGPTVDGIAAFVRLLGLVARTRLSLSQIDARIPEAKLLRADGADPVGGQGRGHALGRRGRRRPPRSTPPTASGSSRTTASWVLVLPDPAEAVTHLWAEGPDVDSAQALLEHWARVVEEAAGG